jgi:hypothetical protein
MNRTSYHAGLLARRDEVVRELQEATQEVARLSEQLAVREAHLRNLEELIRIEGIGPASTPVGATNGRPSARFLDAAEALLRESRRPVHYLEVAKRLQADGVFIPGKNPAANLLTRMTRDRRFKKTGRGTYTITRTPAA